MTIRASLRNLLPLGMRRWLRPTAPPWVVAELQPDRVALLDNFAFYAIVGAWMEADVIAETVANAFAQGVGRVFLFDNDSPDDTVGRAVAAGAECVLTYRTEFFDEQYRCALMNEFVRHTSATSAFDHVWWLWFDADEFPRRQGSGTLRDMLQTLDQRFRVVGARFINHYPSPGRVAHVAGEHPVGHQPLCEELPFGICAQLHRKHPLQRWDRRGPRIEAGLGFHHAECAVRPLVEPFDPAVIQHFPFRNEAATRRRMEALWRGIETKTSRAKQGDVTTDHMEARLRSLDAVYSGDWQNVHNFMPGAPDKGVTLVDWRELTPPVYPDVLRWTARE